MGIYITVFEKKTNIISCDISGGFDSRTALSIILNSGVKLNEILMNSAKDKKHVHAEDFSIASNISSKFGFKLNNLHFANKGTI